MATELSPSELKIESEGEAVYRQRIRPLVYPQHKGRIVAIDVASGEYEVDDDEMVAWRKLTTRCPDAVVWFKRVGYQTVHAFGGLKPDEDD